MDEKILFLEFLDLTSVLRPMVCVSNLALRLFAFQFFDSGNMHFASPRLYRGAPASAYIEASGQIPPL